MAEKYKTPEELGNAVGLKIEELFGTIVADLPPEEPEPQSRAQEPMKSVPVAPVMPPAPPRDAAREQRPPAEYKPQQARPLEKSQPRVTSPSPSASNAQGNVGNSCEELLERIEVLVLNLEWEASPESVREIFQRCTQLERFFSQDQSARNILIMNRRVLPRFKDPGAVPHRSLLRLLQGSVTALRSIYLSQGRKRPPEELMAAITRSYKEIASSPPLQVAAPGRVAEAVEQNSRQRYVSLVANLGESIRSIDEVNRRLGKILGVLRQGGGMSGEEISRRLGTLEHLMAERVEHLSSFHTELAHISPTTDGVPTGPDSLSQGTKGGPDGLFMMMWGGASLAIPSSVVAAFYPLTKAQAQQFQDKPSIAISGRPVRRLPLKKPQGARTEGTALPAWLVHLSSDQKDYFLLAERLLGYRKTPKGVDIAGQTRIKIGPNGYTLINQTIFR
ncbi:MAG: hypothetical protein ACLP5H_06335 [Desulfomonilaceae bacterium]